MNSIIFHIDVNSAFLSWTALSLLEQGNPLDLRDIPSIIGGDKDKRHGIVLAKSPQAKSYGIQTGEPIVNAFKKCPILVMAPPDHTMYHKRSQELMHFLSSICPDIEQVSIDECYMNYAPIAHQFENPLAAAHSIKDQIQKKFGFTVNIGISDRKVLAKMASDFQKPNLVHTLFSYEIEEKMWPLPVEDLFMCGHSSVEALRKLEILTIGDLANADLDILLSHLKSHGKTLWNFANGIDNSAVETLHEKAKGIGNSTTVSKDITEAEDAYKVLISLAESVGGRLRKEKQLAGNVCCEIKYNTFQSVSHQTTLTTPTDSTTLIYETARLLFDELWNGNPIRLLGIRTSKLTDIAEPIQLSLFDMLPTKSNSNIAADTSGLLRKQKQEKLDKALDCIKNKYGKNSVVRGSLLTDKNTNNHKASF